MMNMPTNKSTGKKQQIFKRFGLRMWRITVAVFLLAAMRSEAAPRSGEAIVVAHMGQARARYPVETVHEGRRESRDLFTGASVGEMTRITTGRNGHLCMVLSPGALMHVPPNTEVIIQRLRHTADGLPRSEDDLKRQIVLQLNRGGLYIDGGTPTPSLDIRIQTPVGEVRSHGAEFSLSRLEGDAGWGVVCEGYEVDMVAGDTEPVSLEAGHAAVMTAQQITDDPSLIGSEQFQFKICRGFFRDIEQFRHHLRGFDRHRVAEYIGLSASPVFLGDYGLVADVSPSFRVREERRVRPALAADIGASHARRWDERRIWAWWNSVGVIRGVNYVPRNCVNSTEMWMGETFDTEIIEEELSWAKDAGFTAVRVILQQVVWQNDPQGLIERLDRFLKIANDHGLTVVPVLFDDLNRARREPDFGPQPEPVPDVHNAQWVPSPGRVRVVNMEQWEPLEHYVRAVVGEFKRDRRILYWDLYNTAGNDELWEQTLPLMDQVFNWVRDIDPRQPLAVPAWKELGGPMSARKLERSDLVTFHSFENREMVDARLHLLQRYNRPIVLSDWLMRQRDNTFEEILPVLAHRGAGWFSHGLVQGRTQTWIQEDDYRDEDAPDVWQHDLLYPDGKPYHDREVELIRGFRYHEGANR